MLFRIWQKSLGIKANTSRWRINRSKGALLGKMSPGDMKTVQFSYKFSVSWQECYWNFQWDNSGMMRLYFTQYKMLSIPCSISLNTHMILTHCDNPKYLNRFSNATRPNLESLSIDTECLWICIVFEKAESRPGSYNENLTEVQIF